VTTAPIKLEGAALYWALAIVYALGRATLERARGNRQGLPSHVTLQRIGNLCRQLDRVSEALRDLEIVGTEETSRASDPS
jgi:hypothetical protein